MPTQSTFRLSNLLIADGQTTRISAGFGGVKKEKCVQCTCISPTCPLLYPWMLYKCLLQPLTRSMFGDKKWRFSLYGLLLIFHDGHLPFPYKFDDFLPADSPYSPLRAVVTNYLVSITSFSCKRISEQLSLNQIFHRRLKLLLEITLEML